MKVIAKEKINLVLSYLAEHYQLFAPVCEDGLRFDFAEITDVHQINLGFANSHESPKKLFFPQYEVLFRYFVDGRREEPDLQLDKRRVIFGIRPCDARALTILDKVFDDAKFKDPYYLARRENTIIFAMGCNRPQSVCFCTSFGIGPFFKESADVFVAELSDVYLFEVVTDTGRSILAELTDLTDATEQQIQEYEMAANEAVSKVEKRAELDGIAEHLAQIYDDSVWDEIHQKCINCGICSFLCPTCHCFDIIDESYSGYGARVRIWDCCMSDNFTREASGHNPRPTGKEKMRQRIMHKFRYFFENCGVFACVGCGRCIRNCPVRNDIVKIINRLRGAGKDKK